MGRERERDQGKGAPTVLLVDDVELFLELEKSFLSAAGYEVVTALSAEQARDQMERQAPDILLLDLYLPGLDGDLFCRQLRKEPRWRDLPIIMVTAAGKKQEIKKCLDAECDDYLTKPINKKELLEKVRRLLGEVRSRTAERKVASLRVQLKGGGKSIDARARDISENGIFIRTGANLPPGTPVELRLELPDGSELPVLGKVKRVKAGPDPGIGIYFIRPEAQGRKLLETLGQAAGENAAAPELCAPVQREEFSGGEGAGSPREEIERLHQRIAALEEENRDFAEQIIRSDEMNNNLTNLYVVSSRLHSVLDREQVGGIINEVVINFIGAETFALLLYSESDETLRFETGEGLEPKEFPQIDAAEGIWRQVIQEQEPYFQEGHVAQGSENPQRPLAAIPLCVRGRLIGVLAVYRLFVQKESFAPVDYQLFSMMAEHAATALFSSMLYQDSERKRETYKGFMNLLLK